uniref:ORF67b n=1 Tax=Pinus thunbergii TaxID=3350 RepID=Q32987_PINTH|nr:ORF67b [Pinus thunbergii]BAA04431.1 ORF67b [Pinus thunbergii]
MSLPGWQHGEANGRWDSINLFRPGMISSWFHFTVETRKNTSIYELYSDVSPSGSSVKRRSPKSISSP